MKHPGLVHVGHTNSSLPDAIPQVNEIRPSQESTEGTEEMNDDHARSVDYERRTNLAGQG
jgi:hypothetical protein